MPNQNNKNMEKEIKAWALVRQGKIQNYHGKPFTMCIFDEEQSAKREKFFKDEKVIPVIIKFYAQPKQTNRGVERGIK